MKDALLATVAEEHAVVLSFAALLAQEEHALTALSPLELLPPLVEQKTALIYQLAVLEQTRDAQLAALGFPAGRPGLEQAAHADERLGALWPRVKEAVDHARGLNLVNGALIATRMDYNARALASLQVVIPKPAAFYGPDGKLPAK
ncbi:flagellar protein FlgN [Paraburkholderia bonniea]|uniref:flagella synthesis protein FlgN n=1 Tax=Paraburkholderia bonniea TaxID=2152891 RepID=UPI0012922DCC|nr:flagellar protein FlgN [Paraburkholderia bonniea]WJF90435.1 flagellar protein FlgN [Paraburkholderia bonniea]WJF93750.1 flagellar protein FlgN [Paraburkholderia bonniea]